MNLPPRRATWVTAVVALLLFAVTMWFIFFAVFQEPTKDLAAYAFAVLYLSPLVIVPMMLIIRFTKNRSAKRQRAALRDYSKLEQWEQFMTDKKEKKS
jgi:hypothetical protein